MNDQGPYKTTGAAHITVPSYLHNLGSIAEKSHSVCIYPPSFMSGQPPPSASNQPEAEFVSQPQTMTTSPSKSSVPTDEVSE